MSTATVSPSSFLTSTHRQYWLFSSTQQLQTQRELYHNTYRQQHQQQQQQQTPVSASSSTTPIPPPSKPKQLLTLDEEHKLLLYYHCVLTSLSGRFVPPIPVHVQSTAHLYLARFYCRHSVMDYHPKQMMLCALMLACKVEEHHIEAYRIAAAASTTTSSSKKELGKESDAQIVSSLVSAMVKLEVPLLEGIGFHLRCFHPYRACRGITANIREGWTNTQQHTDETQRHTHLQQVEELALSRIGTVYYTDAILLFNHSQIALAAMVQVTQQALWTHTEEP